jgi:hypothetical protein
MRRLSETLFFRAELAMLLALLLLPALPIHAQVFKIEGGDSTLFQAQGGSVEFKAPNYSGSLGLGFFEGKFELGATLRTQLHGYTYTAGDDSVRFDLPTDIFDTDYYFFARGMGVSKEEKDQGFYAFAGVTSDWVGTGFFQAAQAEDPVAILFFHRKLTDKLRFYSRSIMAKRETALEALEWQPEKWLKLAVTGGIGSGHGYFATAFDAETKKLSVRASYVDASPDFRRIMVPSILNSEADKENIDVSYHATSALDLTVGHHNLLQPLTLQSPLTQATTNDFAGSFHFRSTYMGAGLFTSTVSDRDTQGVNVYVGHRFHERLDVTGNYFDSRTSNEPSEAMFSGTFREILSPRLSVLQLLTHANGQWNIAYGGEFLTNRFSISASYQNVYLPLRPDRPFEQALSLNASVRLFGSVRFTVASSVAPDGGIRYTFGGSTYLYRYSGLAGQSREQESYSFPKYLVQGVVRDKDGNPIAGAALGVDGEVIYTDDAGRFLYRSRKHTRMRFQVLIDQFLVPGVFEVVQSPGEVETELEDKAQDVSVIIRQRRTAPIDLRQVPSQTPAGGSGSPAAEPSSIGPPSGAASPVNR